jgi:hypothetical protein
MKLVRGDMVKFDRINSHTPRLNNKTAIYLGEAFIHRDDGVIIENHKIWIAGDTGPSIIDKSLLRHLRLANEKG